MKTLQMGESTPPPPSTNAPEIYQSEVYRHIGVCHNQRQLKLKQLNLNPDKLKISVSMNLARGQ